MFNQIRVNKTRVAIAQIATAALMLVASSASATFYLSSDDTLWVTPNLPTYPYLNQNPGRLGMYEYVPEKLPTEDEYVGGVVVLLHGCFQNAAEFASESGWVAQANLHGFSIIAPQQSVDNNGMGCFNWFNSEDQTRDSGEALSIKQMIENFAERRPDRFNADNVKVSGFSAGGGMAAVMLATYPDVFSGGAIMAGIPFKCATNVNESGGCMDGSSTSFGRSAAQWGELVRRAREPLSSPMPCGSWPLGDCRWPSHKLKQVSIFAGTQDGTVVPKNADALVAQWTNFLDVSSAAYVGPTLIGGSAHPAGYWMPVTHVETSYSDTVYNVSHRWGNHDVSILDSSDGSCGRPGQDVEAMGLCSTTQAMKNWGW